jgi:hypothetical protein
MRSNKQTVIYKNKMKIIRNLTKPKSASEIYLEKLEEFRKACKLRQKVQVS